MNDNRRFRRFLRHATVRPPVRSLDEMNEAIANAERSDRIMRTFIFAPHSAVAHERLDVTDIVPSVSK